MPRRRSARTGVSAALAALAEGGLLLLLIAGLAPGQVSAPPPVHGVSAFQLRRPLPPPAPRPVPSHPVARHPGGSAAPANLRAKAARTIAPAVVLRPDPRPAALATPATGVLATTGAADRPGPGTGAGGQGIGFGAGNGVGNGVGSGSGEGDEPVWLGGRIKDSDYPREAREFRAEGTVATQIAIDARGRPTACRLVRSSGNGALDAATCRLVLKRFRFRPALDAAGRPRPGVVDYDQEWTLGTLREETDEDEGG